MNSSVTDILSALSKSSRKNIINQLVKNTDVILSPPLHDLLATWVEKEDVCEFLQLIKNFGLLNGDAAQANFTNLLSLDHSELKKIYDDVKNLPDYYQGKNADLIFTAVIRYKGSFNAYGMKMLLKKWNASGLFPAGDLASCSNELLKHADPEHPIKIIELLRTYGLAHRDNLSAHYHAVVAYKTIEAASIAIKALWLLSCFDLLTPTNLELVTKQPFPDRTVTCLLFPQGLAERGEAAFFQLNTKEKRSLWRDKALSLLMELDLVTMSNQLAVGEHQKPEQLAQVLAVLKKLGFIGAEAQPLFNKLVGLNYSDKYYGDKFISLLRLLANCNLLRNENSKANLSSLLNLDRWQCNSVELQLLIKPNYFQGVDAQTNFWVILRYKGGGTDYKMTLNAMQRYGLFKEGDINSCLNELLKHDDPDYPDKMLMKLYNYGLADSESISANYHSLINYKSGKEAPMLSEALWLLQSFALLTPANRAIITNEEFPNVAVKALLFADLLPEPRANFILNADEERHLWVLKLLTILTKTELLTTANLEAVQQHQKPHELAQIVATINQVGLAGAKVQNLFNRLIDLEDLNPIIVILKIVTSRNLLKGEQAKANLTAVMNHPRLLKLSEAVSAMHIIMIDSTGSDQLLLNMLVESNYPEGIVQAFFDIKMEGVAVHDFVSQPIHCLSRFLMADTLIPHKKIPLVHKCLQHFFNINWRLPRNQRIELLIFFVKNKKKIKNLIKIMEENAFVFLQQLSVNSLMPVKRFLVQYERVPDNMLPGCKKLYTKFQKQAKQDAYRQQWLNILLIWGLLSPRNSNYLTTLNQQLVDNTNLQDYFTTLSHYLAGQIAPSLKSSNIPITAARLLEKVPIHLLPKLVCAREVMKNSEYNHLFEQMLLIDLSNEANINQFVTKSNNSQQEVIKLNRHNQLILQQLTRAKIDVDLVFNYHKTLAFTVGGKSFHSIESQCKVVWNSFELLCQHVVDSQGLLASRQNSESDLKQTIKELSALANNLNKYRKKMLIGNNAQETPSLILMKNKMLQEDMIILAQKITEAILRLKTKPSAQAIRSALTSVIEQGVHFSDYFQQLLLLQQKILKRKETIHHKPRSFRVERWDKNSPLSFFLGDMLSCCLATDGPYFAAMVQRRMDVAMLMNVVIEEETGFPVCGNWLFFAEDIDNPDDVYLVANFFEINAGLATNQSLRTSLVDHLLLFTGDFAQAINAKGFLLRPLTYGQIPDFKQFGALKPIRVKKVGGSLGYSETNILKISQEIFSGFINECLQPAINEFKEQPALSTILSELNSCFLALKNESLMHPDYNLSVEEQCDLLNSYNNIKRLAKKLTVGTSSSPTLEELVSDSLKFIIDFLEKTNRKMVNKHYFLDALLLSEFHLYQAEAMAHLQQQAAEEEMSSRPSSTFAP